MNLFNDKMAKEDAKKLNELLNHHIDNGILLRYSKEYKNFKEQFTKNQFKVVWRFMQEL